jgi:hypothetical protein
MFVELAQLSGVLRDKWDAISRVYERRPGDARHLAQALADGALQLAGVAL